MMTKKSLLVLFAGIFIAAGITILARHAYAGVAPPLSREEVRALVKCQETIKEEGFEFVKTKLKGLERCSDLFLELQLEDENGLLEEGEFDKRSEKIEEKCQEFFVEIGKDSTKLIDKIIDKCKPVENIIFDSEKDPLGFVALFEMIGQQVGDGVDIHSAEELASFICVAKELLADLMIAAEIPTSIELLFSILLEGLLPIDERCLIPELPAAQALAPLMSLLP